MVPRNRTSEGGKRVQKEALEKEDLKRFRLGGSRNDRGQQRRDISTVVVDCRGQVGSPAS